MYTQPHAVHWTQEYDQEGPYTKIIKWLRLEVRVRTPKSQLVLAQSAEGYKSGIESYRLRLSLLL